jgi:hypothetical protein
LRLTELSLTCTLTLAWLPLCALRLRWTSGSSRVSSRLGPGGAEGSGGASSEAGSRLRPERRPGGRERAWRGVQSRAESSAPPR